MTQKSINIAAGVTFVALLALFGFGVDAKLDSNKADADKKISYTQESLNNTRGDLGNVAITVDANRGKTNDLQMQINAVVAKGTATNADINAKLDALKEATMLLGEADAAQAKFLDTFIESLGVALEKEFAAVKADIAQAEFEAAKGDEDLAMEIAMANAKMAASKDALVNAYVVANSGKIKRLTRKLNAKEKQLEWNRLQGYSDNRHKVKMIQQLKDEIALLSGETL